MLGEDSQLQVLSVLITMTTIQELDYKDAQLQLFMADNDSVLETDTCTPCASNEGHSYGKNEVKRSQPGGPNPRLEAQIPA